MSLLDFVFPKFCINCRKFGSYLCSDCFSLASFVQGGFCTVCQKAAIGGLTHPICKNSLTIDGVFSSLNYTGVVKKLVYQFKYKPHLTNLKDLLTELFYEGLVQKETFYKLLQKDAVFVPIPLFAAKKSKRGYNQSELLAKGIGEEFGISVVNLLLRAKNTKTQVGLTQIERKENIKDAFAIKPEFKEVIKKYQQIFLIDDVVTSGATLKEAAKVLKKNGVSRVWGVTFAHGN